MDAHMPDAPKSSGSAIIAPTSNTSVRKKDMAADTVPLPREVKNDEP